jgi:omega-6 fatty acid desaturase (delta-12 desaturase)
MNNTKESLAQLNRAWKQAVIPFQNSDNRQAIWQIVNSFGPYLLLWFLMVLSLQVSYILTLLLSILAAGFLVRIFIIFHDCGHGSFFNSSKANAITGIMAGLLTFTPYYQWRHNHAIHHATAGDLDRRGVGDVLTLTIKEYLAAPWWKKLGYSIIRYPLFLFTIGATFSFLVGNRFPGKAGGRRERAGVWWTNLALAGIIAGLSALIGFKAYVMVQLPITVISCSVGVWLFYVQHNFDGTYWARHSEWNFALTGLQGSSFYKLPRLLKWFSGNIGFHHIHHLSPRIPNYKLEQCHNSSDILQVKPLTIMNSLKSLKYRFWDEELRQMVGYERIKAYRQG